MGELKGTFRIHMLGSTDCRHYTTTFENFASAKNHVREWLRRSSYDYNRGIVFMGNKLVYHAVRERIVEYWETRVIEEQDDA